MGITKRVFLCERCGWHSSAFGHKSRIDKRKLEIARKEVEEHFRESHDIEDFSSLLKLERAFSVVILYKGEEKP